MQLLAIWFGKIIYLALRTSGRRGSALPGLVVERLFPNFLAKTLGRLEGGVIVITGTNGKTTSTKMLAHILSSQKRVLTNPTGSNFIRGIIASIIHDANWLGSIPYDIAVIELDEAYAARFVDLFKPRGVIITNVMRDQMDRFGEIDNTAKLLTRVVKEATEFAVLNRDDHRVYEMAEHAQKKVYYFGVSPELRPLFLNDDELHEPNNIVHSVQAVEVELKSLEQDGTAIINMRGKDIVLNLAVKSSFNAQNAAAVCAAAIALDINVDIITTAITEVKPAFGRGEIIKFNDKTIVLQLVKNPGGFRHALISQYSGADRLTMIAINDDYADGRDVSWLWDVDFSRYLKAEQGSILVSGSRAADMALRLKYDDIAVDKIIAPLEECLIYAIDKTGKGETLTIFTTYTAMLALRKLLAEMTEVETV